MSEVLKFCIGLVACGVVLLCIQCYTMGRLRGEAEARRAWFLGFQTGRREERNDQRKDPIS